MMSTFHYNVVYLKQCLAQHIVAYIHGPNDFVKQGNVHLVYKHGHREHIRCHCL